MNTFNEQAFQRELAVITAKDTVARRYGLTGTEYRDANGKFSAQVPTPWGVWTLVEDTAWQLRLTDHYGIEHSLHSLGEVNTVMDEFESYEVAA